MNTEMKWFLSIIFGIIFGWLFYCSITLYEIQKRNDLPSCVAELRRSEVVLEYAAKGLCAAQGIAESWEQTAQNCNNKTGK